MTEPNLIHGDCLVVMREMEANTFTAIVTDPPYGLEFMGKDWDHGIPGVPFWEQALRVTKPGGMLLAFGGTRTYHRLTCAIEDAGWEIRDCLMWLTGQGFPKSHSIGKAIDKVAGTESALPWEGWGTALKPAWEPIVLAMKPLDGTFAENALKWFVAGLNILGCRKTIRDEDRAQYEFNRRGFHERMGKSLETRPYEGGWKPNTVTVQPSSGRWPANLTLDDSAAEMLDEQSGGGGASRFFYVAKASRSERNAGLEGCEKRPLRWSSGDRSPGTFQSEGTDKTAMNFHPTVKPVALMRHLVRLVTMPSGTHILDPFMGSGTTGMACKVEGVAFTGIEQDADYLEIARKRIEAWRKGALPTV